MNKCFLYWRFIPSPSLYLYPPPLAVARHTATGRRWLTTIRCRCADFAPCRPALTCCRRSTHHLCLDSMTPPHDQPLPCVGPSPTHRRWPRAWLTTAASPGCVDPATDGNLFPPAATHCQRPLKDWGGNRRGAEPVPNKILFQNWPMYQNQNPRQPLC
jgi:hypothetical protein